jgi:hypothetical protein
MASDDVIVQGDTLEKTIRTYKSGATKQRFTIAVKSDRLIHNLSPKALGKEPAQAIVKHLRGRIEGVSARVAEATLKARAVARRALERGKPWAMKRYAGGQMGEMPPGTGDTMLNDSGRMAKGITARGTDEKWVIFAPANRLNPDTVDGRGARGGETGLMAIWETMKQLVPELGDPDMLADSIPVRRALQTTVDNMITHAKSEARDSVLELVEMGIRAFEYVDELIAG